MAQLQIEQGHFQKHRHVRDWRHISRHIFGGRIWDCRSKTDLWYTFVQQHGRGHGCHRNCVSGIFLTPDSCIRAWRWKMVAQTHQPSSRRVEEYFQLLMAQIASFPFAFRQVVFSAAHLTATAAFWQHFLFLLCSEIDFWNPEAHMAKWTSMEKSHIVRGILSSSGSGFWPVCFCGRWWRSLVLGIFADNSWSYTKYLA